MWQSRASPQFGSGISMTATSCLSCSVSVRAWESAGRRPSALAPAPTGRPARLEAALLLSVKSLARDNPEEWICFFSCHSAFQPNKMHLRIKTTIIRAHKVFFIVPVEQKILKIILGTNKLFHLIFSGRLLCPVQQPKASTANRPSREGPVPVAVVSTGATVPAERHLACLTWTSMRHRAWRTDPPVLGNHCQLAHWYNLGRQPE